MASSENTTNTNFYTPMAATARRLSQSWEDVESADTSTESVDTSNLKAKDRQNAIQFHKYMIKAGHRFLTCYNQLLWYKPGDGIYTAYELTNNNNKKDLRGYVGNCPNIHEDYQESTGKQNAMMTQFFSIVDTDNEFYEKSLINTKLFMAFKNGVFDYKKQELKAFSPDYYFTLKAPIDYKDRSQLDSKTIEKVRQKLFTDIFGEEKGDFALKSLARALAGNVSDKRFFVVLGKTNSGKGTLSAMLENCFGLNRFIGGYDTKSLTGTGNKTQSWLYQNKNCRIILGNEIDKDKPISAKQLTMCASGGDAITSEVKWIEVQTFRTQGTFFLFANKMPPIKSANDGSNSIENRMVYINTEYSYLNEDEYQKHKGEDGVRRADAALKDDFILDKKYQEAFVYLLCSEYKSGPPPRIPECILEKGREFTPDVPLDTLIADLVQFTGKDSDFVVASELNTRLHGTPGANKSSVGAIMKKLGAIPKERSTKALGGTKTCYLRFVWKENTTIYEPMDDDTSSAVSSNPQYDKVLEQKERLLKKKDEELAKKDDALDKALQKQTFDYEKALKKKDDDLLKMGAEMEKMKIELKKGINKENAVPRDDVEKQLRAAFQKKKEEEEKLKKLLKEKDEALKEKCEALDKAEDKEIAHLKQIHNMASANNEYINDVEELRLSVNEHKFVLKAVEKKFPECKLLDDDDNFLPQIREHIKFGYDKFSSNE